jgi:hypothetical protein
VRAAEPSLPDKVVAVHRSLEAARVPHAFGGALALAYYAEPRATIDIDVNVFVPVAEAPKVLRALSPLGVETDGTPPPGLMADGQCRVMWGHTPLDLFFSYDPFHEAMAGSVRSVPFGEESIPVLSPEHLLACKVVFDRPKDWLDVEQMLLAVDGFDVAEARVWVERILGSEADQLHRLDRVVADVLGL